jgi:hypothetical protein
LNKAGNVKFEYQIKWLLEFVEVVALEKQHY